MTMKSCFENSNSKNRGAARNTLDVINRFITFFSVVPWNHILIFIVWYHEKYGLTPFGVVPEFSLRPLIKERNQAIASKVAEAIKT